MKDKPIDIKPWSDEEVALLRSIIEEYAAAEPNSVLWRDKKGEFLDVDQEDELMASIGGFWPGPIG